MSVKLRSLISLLSFCGFILLFVATNSYYPPATLRLLTKSSAEVDLLLYLDSGKGFNSYQFIETKIPASAQPSSEQAPSDQTELPKTVEIVLPQFAIKALRLQRKDLAQQVELSQLQFLSQGETIDLVAPDPTLNEPLEISPFFHQRSQWHWGLLTLQLTVALFCAWIFWLISGLSRRLKTKNLSETLRLVLIDKRRWTFWSMWLISVAFFSLWFLIYWPGGTTNDSWSTLSDAQNLKLTDWHPYIYTLYVLVLQQFGGTTANIAAFQILLTAGFVSYVFYFCLRCGVSKWVIAIFFLIFITSIPIGLYNTIIWKDVPFSIFVTIVCFFLYRIQLTREACSRYISVPTWSYPFIGLVLIGVCMMRHNGLVYYLVIPLLTLGRLKKSDYFKLLTFLVVSYIALHKVVPATFDIAKTKTSPYHKLRTVLGITTHYAFYSETRKQDIELIEEVTGLPWEKALTMFPVNWFEYWDSNKLVKTQWEADGGETEQYSGKFLVDLIQKNLPIFLAIRTYDFFHSIGIDTQRSDQANNFFQNPLQLHGSNMAPPGRFQYNVALSAPNLFPSLRQLLESYSGYFYQYDGLFSPQVLMWNLVIPFAVFFALLWWEPGFSPISLFVLGNLAAAAAVFLAGAGESWRYFYYIYLSWIIVIPIYLASRSLKAQACEILSDCDIC